ncbi:unnamed protein product [Didymodactylos carnosus]|uniref:Uncharacterized protein n=1 Tax=Didymodactylos carnosus TaxID=1234261 RepID=A0A816FZL4_9BILA|nr:unnamed protein product [Didymodactylos carnosus]CAF4634043.1 unnamed protein product [Didymodactylos carnosus]
MFGIKLQDGLKFMSSLLLPLVLGVFTVVITFEQQKAAKHWSPAGMTFSRIVPSRFPRESGTGIPVETSGTGTRERKQKYFFGNGNTGTIEKK